MIGDKDPEDAYDAGDPTGVRLDVLERIVAHLRANPDDPRRAARTVDALRLVANLEHELAEQRPRLHAIRLALEEL